ncbi:hypothetical protein [Nitrosospira briensis]|uniref:hypothetical protein n=1 Tax=Nitrosospira briensis TaxID=35799 RepID=UPI000469DC88|nr:hypothetical protein [Nitrosospira briensis]
MKLESWLWIIVLFATTKLVHANCDNTALHQTSIPDTLLILSKSVMSNPLVVPCESLTTILNKLMSREKTGGRKLENDKPLDQQKAKGNLQEALNNPETRARIDKIADKVTNENERLIYEAAILDEDGYYDARELKIQQLKQKLY